MVVGAYTIINTLGLLCGLPYTTIKAPNEVIIDINNNFTDYVLKYYFDNGDINQILLKSNSCIIVETEDTHYFTNSIGISTYGNFGDNPTYNYTVNYMYHSKIGNYLIYTANDIVSDDQDDNKFYMDLTTEVNQDDIYHINQIYLGVLTSSLQPINGDSIIGSITSGLGLMGDITSNFKNGFSALIWNSEKNSLTTFGNFALIFLGVSITFAIIKLCLNLIRSKTGA